MEVVVEEIFSVELETLGVNLILTLLNTGRFGPV